MPRTQSENGGGGQGVGQPGRGGEGGEPSVCCAAGRAGWVVSFQGASSIFADAEVGVGDGAHDRLVHITAQAPLTRTLVVNPIERLQRHGARGVPGCVGLLWAPIATCLTPRTRRSRLFSDGASPDCLPRGRCGPGGPSFWFPFRLICSY